MTDLMLELNELLSDRELLAQMAERFNVIKDPNFGKKERDPIDAALKWALNENLKALKEFSLKVTVK